MKKILFITLLLSCFLINKSATAQSSMWKTLAKITFTQQFDDLMGFDVDIPVFSQKIKDLDGKEITIKGYIIPVEGYKSHKEFIFSAFPYNMCYFCGGAGPESVMEVKSTEAVKYTAEPVTLKGILQLNSSEVGVYDINRLMYFLTDAKLVKN